MRTLELLESSWKGVVWVFGWSLAFAAMAGFGRSAHGKQ